MRKRLNVTESFVPKMEVYSSYLQRAFDSKWLTNRGELTLELESRLKDHLDIENLTLMTNGTIPLQIALKILGNKGEIITTPFSYIASSSSIVWENCTPVYVDIEPDHLTIDASKIEAAITSKTTAILATHVFGNPCDVERIAAIAEKHNLHVIYDAAHCFGVQYKEKSLFNYGDISTCSFHATKLFHCGEGGALVCNTENLRAESYYSHNFGHDGPLEFHGLGINGKISELQSAMGLAVFDNIDYILSSRKSSAALYFSLLEGQIQTLVIRKNTVWNGSYFPVIFKDEATLLRIEKHLNEHQIFPRRYFYPALNTIPYLSGDAMPIAEEIAGKILCLPLFAGIPDEDVKRVCKIIIDNL